MPDLTFAITGTEPAEKALAPLLQFTIRVTNAREQATVHGGMLNAQIQIQAPLRSYNRCEQERLVEIFGPPARWGETLRSRLWTQASLTLPKFGLSADVALPVLGSFDPNALVFKYFQALEDGDIPLLFLFSGAVFYSGADGRLQMQRIPWDQECAWRMPLGTWRALVDRHFPNSFWLELRRDTLEQLCAYRRSRGLGSWEEVIHELLPTQIAREATT